MNKLIIAILGLLAALGTIGAVNFTVNSTMGSGNASMVTASTNGTYSHSASQQVIYAAQSYIVSKLNQSYYNSYISYYYAESLGNSSYVYFKYNVPFSNGNTTMGLIGGSKGPARFLGITVSLNGTNVTGYIGPAKPYVINITQAQAINTSAKYGIQNGTATIYGLFQNSSITPNSKYSVVWAVTSASPQKGTIYPGVYVNAENGTIVGQYLYNPAIPYQEISANYGSLGNFSLYYMQNQTNSTVNSPNSPYILPLIILAFAFLGIGLYISRKQR